MVNIATQQVALPLVMAERILLNVRARVCNDLTLVFLVWFIIQ